MTSHAIDGTQPPPSRPRCGSGRAQPRGVLWRGRHGEPNRTFVLPSANISAVRQRGDNKWLTVWCLDTPERQLMQAGQAEQRRHPEVRGVFDAPRRMAARTAPNTILRDAASRLLRMRPAMWSPE